MTWPLVQVQDDTLHSAGLDLVISNGVCKFQTNGSAKKGIMMGMKKKIRQELTCNVLT